MHTGRNWVIIVDVIFDNDIVLSCSATITAGHRLTDTKLTVCAFEVGIVTQIVLAGPVLISIADEETFATPGCPSLGFTDP